MPRAAARGGPWSPPAASPADAVTGDVEPWNEGSWRAAERAGFVREGLLRSWQRVGDERRDMYMYGFLPGDLAAERP